MEVVPGKRARTGGRTTEGESRIGLIETVHQVSIRLLVLHHNSLQSKNEKRTSQWTGYEL